jgi:hypothetical protein
MGKPHRLFYDTVTGFYDFKNVGSLHLEKKYPAIKHCPFKIDKAVQCEKKTY